MNTFDESTHTYRIGDKTVPSVTQVLDEVGWIDKSWFTPEGAARGTEVHRVLAALDRGEECSYDADIDGYVQAWEAFKALGMRDFDQIETPLFSEQHHYAGTPDRLTADTILDIKTGVSQWWARYQLGGYCALVGRLKMGMIVELRADGTFTTKHFGTIAMLDARNKFMAALTCVSVARAERK